jgi:hypothetical protein
MRDYDTSDVHLNGGFLSHKLFSKAITRENMSCTPIKIKERLVCRLSLMANHPFPGICFFMLHSFSDVQNI